MTDLIMRKNSDSIHQSLLSKEESSSQDVRKINMYIQRKTVLQKTGAYTMIIHTLVPLLVLLSMASWKLEILELKQE